MHVGGPDPRRSGTGTRGAGARGPARRRGVAWAGQARPSPELVAERNGRPGMARLAGLLNLDPIEVRSRPEALLLPICRTAGLPRPRLNHPVDVPTQSRPLIVDLAWPEIRLAIELDSQRFHADWAQAEADRERDQALALAGWECHRFVRRVVVGDPVRVAGRLEKLYALRVGIGLRDDGSDRAPGAARA